jgi:hypothetical protein
VIDLIEPLIRDSKHGSSRKAALIDC